MLTTLLKKLSQLFSSFCLILISSLSFAEEKPAMEKCMGIVKPELADGHVMINGKKESWVLVPAGACAKFTDGRILINKE